MLTQEYLATVKIWHLCPIPTPTWTTSWLKVKTYTGHIDSFVYQWLSPVPKKIHRQSLYSVSSPNIIHSLEASHWWFPSRYRTSMADEINISRHQERYVHFYHLLCGHNKSTGKISTKFSLLLPTSFQSSSNTPSGPSSLRIKLNHPWHHDHLHNMTSRQYICSKFI